MGGTKGAQGNREGEGGRKEVSELAQDKGTGANARIPGTDLNRTQGSFVHDPAEYYQPKSLYNGRLASGPHQDMQLQVPKVPFTQRATHRAHWHS